MVQKIYTTYVALDDSTYYNCQTITQVDLMQTPWVNNRMWGAFENCSNLQIVTNIEQNVTNMQAAFYGCTSLTTAPTIPASVTSLNSCFYSCSNITSMPTIPSNVTDMSYAFMYCNKLNTVTTIPSSVNDICYAFAYTNINTAPTLPQSITELEYTFAFCNELTSAPSIPSNVTLMAGAFQGCKKLATTPTLPPNVEDLSYTFSGCNTLASAPEIPNSVRYLDETFKDCASLSGNIIIRTDNIVHNVVTINTFDNTSLRKNVYIPPFYYNDVNTPSETYNAFIEAGYDANGTKDGVYLCYNYYPALPSDWITSTAANGTTILEQYIGTNTTVVTPHNDWYSNKVLNISPSVTQGPFTNNKNIVSVDLSGVEWINNSMDFAFVECSNLNSVTNINNDITFFTRVFINCHNLKSCSALPNSVVSMYGAFFGCNSLTTSPSIPNSVTNLEFAYDTCTNLQTMPAIPDAVTSLFAGFQNCYQLGAVNTLGNNITNLSFAFSNCYLIENAPALPNVATDLVATFQQCKSLKTITSFGNSGVNLVYMFAQCNNLTSVPPLPSTAQNLHSTFYNCISLTTAPAIPESVNVMAWTFYGSGIYQTPHIPDNVTSLLATFQNCPNLTTVTHIGNSVTSLMQAFDSCNSLTTVCAVPDSVTGMYRAYGYCPSLVTAPVIGNGVVNIEYCFMYSQNLAGNVYIHSKNISRANGCFSGTSLTKNVYIPFEYENGVNTATRNAFEIAYPVNTISGTTVGTLTDNNGVISGFSASNYIRFPELTLGNNFEFGIKFTYIPTSASYQDIVRLEKRLAIAVHTANNNVIHFNSGDGTAWTGNNNDGITPLVSGNTYWIKIIANSDNTWQSYVSANGIDYNLESSGTFISQPTLSYYLGTCDYDFSRWFSGSIDLNESYIKVNGQKVWNGYVRPNGVVLKDIDGSKITLNVTPADATVLMYSEVAGKQIDEDALNKFIYTKVNDDVTINGLNTQDTSIIVPSLWTETNNMRAIDGSKVYYKVFKDGYYPVESQVTVDGSQDINVNLEQIMCTFTVAPMPQDATVTLTTLIPGSEITHYAWYSSGIGQWLYNTDDDYAYTLTDTPTTFDDIYAYRNNILVKVDSVHSYQNNQIIPQQDMDQIDGWVLERDSTKDITSGESYTQVGNSITVPWGTEISYTVSKAHYTAVTGTETVKITSNRYVPLAIDQHTFTINPTPNDASVQILVNGRLANIDDSDWTIKANNLNGDIELQEYTGSNTVVSMPTSFTTTNTITADYGSTIEWKVSKDGYTDKTDTLTLEADTILPVQLGIPSVDTTDYVYIYDGETLTLSKYLGDGTNIETPSIEERYE